MRKLECSDKQYFYVYIDPATQIFVNNLPSIHTKVTLSLDEFVSGRQPISGLEAALKLCREDNNE